MVMEQARTLAIGDGANDDQHTEQLDNFQSTYNNIIT